MSQDFPAFFKAAIAAHASEANSPALDNAHTLNT